MTDAALADFDREHSYSVSRFGEAHARIHFRRFVAALETLRSFPQRCRPSRRLGTAWRILNFDGLQAAFHIDESNKVVTVAGIFGRNRYHQLIDVIRARRPWK